MIHLKKQFYYVRLNNEEKSYLELFDNDLQKRIMEVKNQDLYNNLVIRIGENNFESITNIEFDDKLNEIKNKLF